MLTAEGERAMDRDPAPPRSPLRAVPHVIRRRARSRCRHAQGQGRRDRLLDPRRRHGSLDAADTRRSAPRRFVRRRHHEGCLLERTDVRALRPAGAFSSCRSERAWCSPPSLSQVGGGLCDGLALDGFAWPCGFRLARWATRSNRSPTRRVGSHQPRPPGAMTRAALSDWRSGDPTIPGTGGSEPSGPTSPNPGLPLDPCL